MFKKKGRKRERGKTESGRLEYTRVEKQQTRRGIKCSQKWFPRLQVAAQPEGKHTHKQGGKTISLVW